MCFLSKAASVEATAYKTDVEGMHVLLPMSWNGANIEVCDK